MMNVGRGHKCGQGKGALEAMVEEIVVVVEYAVEEEVSITKSLMV